MHQTSNARNILRAAEALARESGLARVASIRLNVAAWADIDTDELREDVGHAAHGTFAQSARLEIEVVEPRAVCMDCGTEFVCEGASLRCGSCGSARVGLQQVEEITVAAVL